MDAPGAHFGSILVSFFAILVILGGSGDSWGHKLGLLWTFGSSGEHFGSILAPFGEPLGVILETFLMSGGS